MPDLLGSPSPLPRHVVLIPDGNRRWAKAQGCSNLEAYTKSLVATYEVVDHLIDRGVKCVSAWGTSDKQWLRPEEDHRPILKAVRSFLHVVATTYPQRGIKFRAIGARDRLAAFDDLVCRDLERAEAVAQHGEATVLLLLDYGSREEMVRAYRRLHAVGEPLDGLKPERLAGFLDTHGIPDPDLIIRPGGCHRLSGIYAFQSVNAELDVLDDVMMPEFTTDILDELLVRYAARRNRGQPKLAVGA